jgi:HK97 gp10 family phage protein
MNGITFQLTGDKLLDRAFQQLPIRTEKKVLRQALRPAAQIVNKRAKQTIRTKTGTFATSLKVRAGKRTRKNVVRLIVQTAEGFFKGESFYSAFVEFGHHAGSRKKSFKFYDRRTGEERDSRKYIEGKGYIRKAYEQTAEQAKAVAIENIKEGIYREAAALRGRS